jgi:hypothetical protein
MNPISAALSQVTLGIEVTHRNLVMFPLLTHEPLDAGQPLERVEPLESLTLDEALGQGWARVTEVSEAGSVPELRFVNTGSKPVFILDGEELVGAKQNRVVNLSILVPPQCSLTIPVSCVEAGRWHARSRSFAAAPRAQYAAGRARRVQQVTASMLEHGVARSDQSAVWADIAEKSVRLAAHSDTSAMEAMFVGHGEVIDDYVDALAPVPAQIGALFAVGDRVAGLELFQSGALLRKLLPKIVRSYALDAIDPAGYTASKRTSTRQRKTRTATDASSGLRLTAGLFLKATAAAEGKRLPAVGLGDDLRVDAPGIAAAALVHDDRIVHLSAFAA